MAERGWGEQAARDIPSRILIASVHFPLARVPV